MRNLETLAYLGSKKIGSHASLYGLKVIDIISMKQSISEGNTELYEAIVKAYNAGIESGYRMAENDRKRKIQRKTA